MGFAAAGFLNVRVRSTTELSGDQFFRLLPDAALDIATRKEQKFAVAGDPSQGDMHVAMFSVRVNRCYPFKPYAEIFFHLRYELPGQSFEIDALAKLGGNDQLEHSRIVGLLPRAKC